MNNILYKIRAGLMRFMAGRYGADQMGLSMIWGALILSLLGSLTHWMILTLLADALLIWMAVRMLSRDRYKRQHENMIFLQKTAKIRQPLGEWMNRVKNSKKFRYFTCPQCKKRLRVPRGVGQITITCRGCGHRFDKKA